MHELLIDKLCNTLLPDAEPSGVLPGLVSGTVHRALEQLGGLWVGGRIKASADTLTFTADGMNAAVHTGLEPVHIPLSTVSAVVASSVASRVSS